MRIVKLGEVIGPASVIRAGDRDYPLLSMTMHDGLVDQSRKFNKRVASADVGDYKVVSRGQLVVGFPIDEGVLDFQELYDSGTVSPAYGVWNLLDASVVDRRYLQKYLRGPRALAYYKAKLRGSTARRRSLPTPIFLELRIPLPPLAEQRRIAAILDQADSIRAKRRKMLERLDELEQATFQDMFGQLAPTSMIEEVSQRIRTGPFGSQLLHSEFTDQGVAVLGLDNVVDNEFVWKERRYISEEKFAKLTRYVVESGDVLISIMGTVGRCVVVPEGIPTAINTKHLCAISSDPSLVTPHFLRASFLWYQPARLHLRQQTKGSIMDGLNMGIIKATPISIPSLTLQQTFADRIQKINTQRTLVERALAADDELFASLQTRAFRGEI